MKLNSSFVFATLLPNSSTFPAVIPIPADKALYRELEASTDVTMFFIGPFTSSFIAALILSIPAFAFPNRKASPEVRVVMKLAASSN